MAMSLVQGLKAVAALWAAGMTHPFQRFGQESNEMQEKKA
ncbi:hypothetical protein P353_13620 [Comamonas testosteroni]|uniref:Uncharacterized protein n=1 Tax=Comamonas testosteroni TaxID=285 RepID=A0A096FHB6_COMTE|nr:hypothetical protein P353_13620 [Comamonas testosteroni]